MNPPNITQNKSFLYRNWIFLPFIHSVHSPWKWIHSIAYVSPRYKATVQRPHKNIPIVSDWLEAEIKN